jgi:alkylation response protein AidB-like acyl-CoA dehydrogenase
MFHERMLFNSPYVTTPVNRSRGGATGSTVYSVAEELGLMEDPTIRELVGEAHMFELVGETLKTRVAASIRSGRLNDQAAAIGRLFHGLSTVRCSTLGLEVAGSSGAAWSGDGEASQSAVNFLMRQVGSIGGGTTEMARNVIAERVLQMPRERTLDRDVPFRDVPRSRPSTS